MFTTHRHPQVGGVATRHWGSRKQNKQESFCFCLDPQSELRPADASVEDDKENRLDRQNDGLWLGMTICYNKRAVYISKSTIKPMFKDLLMDFLRRYWWGIVAVVVFIVGGIWWYNDNQKVEVSGYKISQEAAQAVKYYANGEIDKAEAQYKSIVENHSNDWFSWNGLANIYRDKSKYDLAEETYLKALAINPRFEQAYRNIYSLYYIWSKDNPDQIYRAEDILVQGVKYLPKSEIVLEEILNYYQKIGDQEKFVFYQDKLNKLRDIKPSSILNTIEFN